METYLNEIAEHLATQIKLQKAKTVALVRIDSAAHRQANAPSAYTYSVWIPNEHKPRSVIIIESQLSDQDEGAFLAIPCIDTLALWLREAVREEPDLPRADFRFFARDGSVLEAKAAAAQILERSSVLITQQLSAWMGVEFRAIDELALLPYEGKKPGGIIALSFSEEAEHVCSWTLEERVPFDAAHVRHIRKLLAGTGKGGGLVLYREANGAPARIIGVCDSLTETIKNRSGLFPIWLRISNWMTWELYVYQRLAFQSRLSGYSAFSETDILPSLENEFGSGRSYSNLQEAVEKIRKQTHGAAAVILDFTPGSKSAAHMEELAAAKKAMKVTFHTTEEALTHAAAMDGAVILDLNGDVRYLAAILDGPSCVMGNISRGSRFNSVKNFSAWVSQHFGEGAVGIICSEDGGADVISGKEALQDAPSSR